MTLIPLADTLGAAQTARTPNVDEWRSADDSWRSAEGQALPHSALTAQRSVLRCTAAYVVAAGSAHQDGGSAAHIIKEWGPPLRYLARQPPAGAPLEDYLAPSFHTRIFRLP